MNIRMLKALPALLCIITVYSPAALTKDLFVSINGDDATPYAENSLDTPWRSLNHAIYNLKSGDSLHIRGGTYYPTHPLILRSDYASKNYGGNQSITMQADSGTADAPITVQSYLDEKVVVDLQKSTSDTFVVVDNKHYWTFKGFKVINGGSAFVVGWNGEATNIVFDSLEIHSIVGGDNSANIKIHSGSAENITIRNSILVGPGITEDIHLNTAVIYARRLRALSIKNNKISNAPIGIYYKHRPEDGAEPIRIELINNIIDKTSRASAQLETVEARIRNNIITPNNAAFVLNEAAGAPGGDYNVVEHNTFGVPVVLRWDTQEGDPIPGAIGNILKNNIFIRDLSLHWYSNVPHSTSTDFNLYSGDYAVGENRIKYLLNEWQSRTGQDQNSLIGQPQFSNDLRFEPRDYKLLSTSPGYRQAEDGTDMGADTSLVGPAITDSGFARPNSPKLEIQ